MAQWMMVNQCHCLVEANHVLYSLSNGSNSPGQFVKCNNNGGTLLGDTDGKTTGDRKTQRSWKGCGGLEMREANLRTAQLCE